MLQKGPASSGSHQDQESFFSSRVHEDFLSQTLPLEVNERLDIQEYTVQPDPASGTKFVP